MLVGIQNVAAANEKTKDPGLHKGNASSQTLKKGLQLCPTVFSSLPCEIKTHSDIH